jgi:hypothetical protein
MRGRFLLLQNIISLMIWGWYLIAISCHTVDPLSLISRFLLL